jgi:hypothetical protein
MALVPDLFHLVRSPSRADLPLPVKLLRIIAVSCRCNFSIARSIEIAGSCRFPISLFWQLLLLFFLECQFMLFLRTRSFDG